MEPKVFLHAIQPRIPNIHPATPHTLVSRKQQASASSKQGPEVITPIQEAEQVQQHDHRNNMNIQLAHQPLLGRVVDLRNAGLDTRRRLIWRDWGFLIHRRYVGPQAGPGGYVVEPGREPGVLLHVRV